ncbi:ribosomal protein L40E [Thermocatellispora tengchongensis]|uniref:Ribosomal protein L40E n=1 Tax=Thermocatellispora tengchongensis TaxID=1073253 RepID=A0A840PIR1_9ACTN|nr:hypothetical protein [Thermocatellispora tengchongensis]MBB5138756.1 ribosomal protein L40E [Thermocatellispora tengchongensis]
MTNEIYPAPACECGARLGKGQTRCRKCRSRELYLKRQNGKRRRETRRPPRGPRIRGRAREV